MEKKNKWFAGMICAALAASLLAGCAASNGSKDTAQNGGGTDAGEGSPAKPKLAFWSLNPDQTKVDSPGVTAIKDKFGIDVEFMPISSDSYKEKVNLMLASGQIPDWWKEPTLPDYEKFIQQGVAAAIPQELVEKNMPNYMKWIKRFLGDDPFKYVKRDGKIYGLPTVWDIGIDGMQLGFREDWLKKVGIDRIPETLLEMEEALTKFRNNDPDGNGKKDTYGMTATGDSLGLFSSVFGAYDVYPGIFREKDGKIVRGEIEPGAKQALEVLNRWYKNELIDPEFVVNKSNNFEDKMLTGKAGAAEYYWWSFIPGAAFLGGKTWDDQIKEADPNAGWVTEGGVKGPDGKYGMQQSSPYSGTGLMFGKQMEKEPEKLEKYLQVFEASQFDAEIYKKLNFGIEGTHYNMSDKGTVEFIAPYNDEKERKKLGINGGYSMSGSFNDYDFQTSFTSDEKLRPLAKSTRTKSVKVFDILSSYQKPVFNEYADRLNQYTLQNYIDFITGRKPLSEFDSFVEGWKKNGGDKVLEEAQKVYDENNR